MEGNYLFFCIKLKYNLTFNLYYISLALLFDIGQKQMSLKYIKINELLFCIIIKTLIDLYLGETESYSQCSFHVFDIIVKFHIFQIITPPDRHRLT